MSLRLRWSLILASVTVVAIGIGATAAYLTTASALSREVERFLLERSGIARMVPGPGFITSLQPGINVPLVRGDLAVQFIEADGDVIVVAEEWNLPVEGQDLLVAAGEAESSTRDIILDEVHYRMMTIPMIGGGAIQIARDLSEADAILTRLRNRLFALGLSGVAVAALIGWWLAGRTVRPIEQLTDAAERVAATKDLKAPVPTGGDHEVRRLAASLNTMLTALATSQDQQQQLIRDAGHELKTPLTSLRTNIELLQRHPDLSRQERNAMLDDAESELLELSFIVEELIELASDAERNGERPEPVALDELAERVATRARRRYHRPIEVTAEPTTVTARPLMLERAVGNLIDNAHKWAPTGSPIEVRVASRRLEVADHGPGIDPADQNLVFERFYRSLAARSTPGSGLGLAIVKHVIDAHGGQIWIKRTPGGGATVGFELPQVES